MEKFLDLIVASEKVELLDLIDSFLADELMDSWTFSFSFCIFDYDCNFS